MLVAVALDRANHVLLLGVLHQDLANILTILKPSAPTHVKRNC